ncbi:PAS domain S-box protein [Nodularia sphaerocarpa]|uniref:PAS domain S-box protein n=1 Tax=Nodularia sphaerocarpa TaxID=137816 RepID=UPI001EFAEFC3|nr:PAS domain S-box protein [Nodularia sphaerocarpa]MDB9375805.1 PAS domain S-box protein [Nodularia sphaerocarpa CS-585]MDB9379075.1 PAS domain S-box protein [Nodularia sphaerocarpa CS-585A2]ULP71878.1 Autoinducer 2 sensor kinase/phosphatase LuxQ [Nodularia sphaerocarpa UHCC 0038]
MPNQENYQQTNITELSLLQQIPELESLDTPINPLQSKKIKLPAESQKHELVISSTQEEGMIFQLADTTIQACNSAAENILGYQMQQILGKTFFAPPWQIIHENGSIVTPETHPAIVALQTSQPCKNIVMGFYNPTGKLRWLLLNCQPLFQANQAAPYAVVTTFIDITEIKLQQFSSDANIQINKKLFITSNQSQPPKDLSQGDFWNFSVDLLCITNLDGHFDQINSAFIQTLGYSFEELVSYSWMDLIHPNDQTATKTEIKKLKTSIPSIYLENRYRCQDGSYKWLGWTVTQVTEAQLIYAVARDISAYKPEIKQQALECTAQLLPANAILAEREVLYRTLMQHIPNGAVYLFDHNLRYLVCEGTELAVVGLEANSMIGKTVGEVFPGETSQVIEPLYRAALSGKTTVKEITYQNQIYETHTVPVRNQQGKIFAGMMLQQNVTSCKQNEALLSLQKDILELIATGVSLQEVLINLVQSIEAKVNQVFCSIMLLDESQTKLHLTVGSSLPEKYIQALADGVPVGAEIGSCGTAAYTKKTVIVSDIANDAKWVQYRDLALLHNLKACWSAPILDSQGHILGTFALYYSTPRSPQRLEQELIESASHLAGVAIERHRSQQALQQSEYLLRLMTETIPQQVWTALPNGEVDYYNQRWRDFTGKTLEQLQAHGWSEIVHPEDLARVEKLWNHAVQTGSEYESEARLLSKSGEYRWILGQALPLCDQEGNIVKWYGTNTDITDHIQAREAFKASELNFRTLADTMPQIVWTARPDGWLDYYNQRWFDYTGMTLEQTQGWSWEPVLHPEDVQITVDTWSECLRTGRIYDIEYRFRRASDGQYRWHLGRAFPLRNHKGEIIKWFGSCTDIDDYKRSESALWNALQQQQAARADAEKANRIKDEFLAVLSHELRTPLNPILGWAHLLKTGKLDKPKTAQAIETIERNAKLQVDLIEDLLDVSRILQGKLTLNVSSVNLAKTISAALESVSLAAAAKEITIQTMLAANIGQVTGDSVRLQQIVWNLLSNAVKFTSLGGKVEVRLEESASMAQIQVSDTGKGISPEFLPYIFDYFRQEDGSITRKFGGLGLGLAIVRQLVELHGGTVKAESSGEGQGATFTVRLPLCRSVATSRQTSPQPAEIVLDNTPPSTTLNLNGMKILVVDDDADSRDFIAFVLKTYGAEVTKVASAWEAFEVIVQSRPDVLVSDIGMPLMDGYELLRKLRVLPPETGGQVPAIALTAFAAEYDQQQAIAAGFQMHIPKPVEPDTLAAAVVQLVQNNS